ncbi:hypothetical protein GPECTOR_185g275 [Gonium pectorale]|uniref:Phytocyanin domain-containing protein n=1 Tax=Gonium pectorale TaxID=33097 RepID=A0A150FX55_GONPE|nr:hypothetical protein GPECTOR_185g275 [Gonium pectorale]|eukprot:KXZ42192.1 hypothetical protein GPECTOR_185g275 [Gonium pectorale]
MRHAVIALAILAACAGLTAAQNATEPSTTVPPPPPLPAVVVLPWVERPGVGYPLVKLNCSDVLRFKWGPEKHDVIQTLGPAGGCSSPKVKEFFDGTNGDVPVFFSYPGNYSFKCAVTDHCPKGKQRVVVEVGQCPQGPNVLAWGFRRDNSTYAPVIVPCGTKITFYWTGRHDVVQVDKPSCDANVTQNHTEIVQGPYNHTIEFTTPGAHHFICSVPNHCTVGRMVTTVHVVPSEVCGMPPRKASPPVHKPPPRRAPPSRRPPPRKSVWRPHN